MDEEFLIQVQEHWTQQDMYLERISDIVSAIPFLLGCIFGAIIIHEFFRRF